MLLSGDMEHTAKDLEIIFYVIHPKGLSTKPASHKEECMADFGQHERPSLQKHLNT